MDLQVIEKASKPLEIEYQGQVLKLEYHPAALTGKLVDDVLAAQENPRQAAVISGALVKVVAKWDMKRGKSPVPVTEESLIGLPVELLGEIFKQINEDNAPGKSKSRTSNGS